MRKGAMALTMRTNYADVCDEISGSPSAILYLDTCIFLDIVRSPVRTDIVSDTAKFAQSLIDRSHSNPRSVWLVTSTTVEMEWRENIAEVLKESERDIKELELRRKRFFSVAESVTGTQYKYDPLPLERSLDLANKLKSVAESLLDACAIVKPEDEHMLSAMKRVIKNAPPAKRDKPEPKDCVIYELFLGLCQELRKRDVASTLMFVSSNTNDYEKHSGGVQTELDSVEAKYMPNLAAAACALDEAATTP